MKLIRGSGTIKNSITSLTYNTTRNNVKIIKIINKNNKEIIPNNNLKNKGVKVSENTFFTVGDVIRIPNYSTCKGYRVWKIIGVYLGGLKQEGTYELLPLDVTENKTIQVPCIILETHPTIKRV